MDVAELWRFLLENPPYLLITVGFGILTFWLVNSVANIVVDPTKKKVMPFLSLSFLIIGFAWLLLPSFLDTIHPSNLTVHGKITYPNGEPVARARIEIPGLPISTTDVKGYYIIENVPTNKKYLNLTIPTKEQYFEPCEINFREKEIINNTILYDYTLESRNFSISGYVYDENEDLMKNATIDVDGKSTPTKLGYYEITDIPCNAKKIKVYNDNKERFSDDSYFLPSEKKTYNKKLDIHLAFEDKVNIYGNISYIDKKGKTVEPVSDAKIEVGGLSGTTDKNGTYEILSVPRNATLYRVTRNGQAIDSGKLKIRLNSYDTCLFERECKNDINILFNKKPT